MQEEPELFYSPLQQTYTVGDKSTDTHLSRHPLIESCQFLPTVVLCRL
jgi:hypothetical protein